MGRVSRIRGHHAQTEVEVLGVWSGLACIGDESLRWASFTLEELVGEVNL